MAQRQLPPPAASNVYELTDYGRELVPIMLALGRWGARSMGPRVPEQTVRGQWFAVALTAFYEPEEAADVTANVAIDFGDAQFTLRLARGALDVVPGTDGRANLSISADPETLVGFLSGFPVALDAEGDPELLARLPRIFPFATP